MKAVVLKAFGGPDNLESTVLPDPIPGPGEILLRVRATAVNHLDLWIRAGLPAAKIKFPFILGCDAAGEVAALGPGVVDIAPGAHFAVHPGRCCGACAACRAGREPDCPDYGIIGAYGGRPGAYAEFLAVPTKHLLPMPQTLDFVQAAAAPLTYLTAWHMLVTLADIKPGETVLVLGAGAGVAVALIQIAKSRGARVIATSTSVEKLSRAKTLGADMTILYPPEDLPKTVRRLTQGGMVDAAFEHIGGDIIGDALKCLRRSGRLVTCGATAGPIAPIDLRYVFDRQLELLGAKMGSLVEMHAVWERICDGTLRPVVDRTLPLEQARTAHELLEARQQFGKIVLTP